MKLSRFFCAAVLALAGASPAAAQRVALDVALGTPVVAAGQPEKAFLKISLTGYELVRPAARAPANVAIVIDKSGSMSGERIVHAREAAAMAVDLLGPEDVLSVVTYDTTVDVLVPATRLTDKDEVLRRISRIQADGSTALFAGVSKGAAELRRHLSRERVNRVILLSDGQANVGPSSPRELGELGASLGKDGISVSTIGLGLGYNEDLMTRLAGYSDGNHAFARNSDDLGGIFQRELGSVLSAVARDLEVKVTLAPGVRCLRVLGRDAEVLDRQVRARLNQLYSGQEAFLMLELELPAGSAGSEKELAQVDVAYLNLGKRAPDRLQGAARVRYSDSAQDVVQARDDRVLGKAVEQITNEASKEAVRLRDEGKVKEAQRVLSRAADAAGSAAAELPAAAPALRQLEAETRRDAQELSDEAQWNSKRKSLRERQYKTEKQQSY